RRGRRSIDASGPLGLRVLDHRVKVLEVKAQLVGEPQRTQLAACDEAIDGEAAREPDRGTPPPPRVIGAGAQAAVARRGRATRRSSNRSGPCSVGSNGGVLLFRAIGTARVQPSRKTPQGPCHPCGAYSNRCTPVRKSRSHLEILVY